MSIEQSPFVARPARKRSLGFALTQLHIGALAGLFCIGCVTTPPPQDQAYSAGYVGDRTSVELDETVVTVWKAEGVTLPLNLHVALGAIVNPRKTTLSSPDEVAGIIRRLEPRINSRVVERLTGATSVTAERMRLLQSEVENIAQSAFNDAFARWSKAADYEVEIVVTSFYLTDLSAGRVRPERRWFW
jgi:hypothetical protein